MKIEKRKIKVILNEEEKKVIQKVVDLLVDLETNYSQEELQPLQEEYERYLDYVPHQQALPTTVDFLDMILGLED